MNFTAILLICSLIFIITLILNSGKFKENKEDKRREYCNKLDKFDEQLTENNIVNNIKGFRK